MKILKLLAIFSILCYVKCEASKDENVLVAVAINGILKKYFEHRESKVDFYYYGVKGGASEEIVELILRSKSNHIPVKVSSQPENDLKITGMRISSVHIFDSRQQFMDTQKQINWIFDPKRRYEQLVYVPNLTAADLNTSFQDGLLWININFLILDPESSAYVDLVSRLLFAPGFCREPVVTVINRFSKKSMKWDSNEFFPKQFQNFNGCYMNVEQRVFENQISDNILAALSTHLKMMIFSSREFPGYYIDFYLYWDDTNHVEMENFSNSVVIYSSHVVLLIPPGEPYSQFEKMYLMFEDDVWIAIGATFVIILTIIQVLRFMSIKVQNFVFGNDVRTPTLNLIDIFLNGGQNRVPSRNFARFILMLFVIWSLVIRTCYQSKFFELLQIDLRKPRFETIDQLIENNFTLYHCRGDEKSCLNDEIINQFKNKVVFDNCTVVLGGGVVAEPSNKVTVVSFSELFRIFMKEELASGTSSMHILSEKIRTSLASVYFDKFSPYYERFTELIDRMNAHGIIKRTFDGYELATKVLRKQEDEVGPQNLSLDHLGLGFVIFLMFLGVCCLVFVMEHILSKITRWRDSRN